MSQTRSIPLIYPAHPHDETTGGVPEKIIALLHQDQAIILVLGTSRHHRLTRLLDQLENTLRTSNAVFRINHPSDSAHIHSQLTALSVSTRPANNINRIILLCDNADSFDTPSLEQLRQLSNLNLAGQYTVSLVLCGSHTLLKKLRKHNRALEQRITAQLELDAPSFIRRILNKTIGPLNLSIAALLLSAFLWSMFSASNHPQTKIDLPPRLPASVRNIPVQADFHAAPPPLAPQNADQPAALDHVFQTEQEALQAIKTAQP